MFKTIANWWKNASWRKPLWRGIRETRDDVLNILEPAVDELIDDLYAVGKDSFKDAIFRAFVAAQALNLSNEEKAAMVKKDMLRTFRYFVDLGKESSLDALQGLFFKAWKRENS